MVITWKLIVYWDILSKSNKIILITHGSSTSLGLNGEINKDNIWNINLLNENACSATKVTIIACNAWKWDDSIAQDLSNELWTNVTAANNYIMINSPRNINDSIGVQFVNDIAYHIWRFVYDKGKPIIIWLGQYKNLTPNY